MRSLSNLPRAYFIDASIYIFRYYFTLPDRWWSVDGFPTAAVYGYSHWLIRFLKSVRPQYISACFDESLESCFRNRIYPAYKSSRVLPDEMLAFQLAACREITELLGIPTYASKSFEADDLIGTLARRSRQRGHCCTIVSRDKDLSQLVLGVEDNLWDHPDGVQMGPKEILTKIGIRPEYMADYLALVGDPGDDIPGVPGIGPKTAATLINRFGGWQQIKSSLKKIADLPIRGAPSVAARLEQYRAQVDIALQLTRIEVEAQLGRRYSITRKKINLKQLRLYSDSLGFGRRFHTSIQKLIDAE